MAVSKRLKASRTAFLGAYAILAALFCYELWLPGRDLHRWDTLIYTWPVIVEARAQLLSGQIPFWAESFCAGTPLLANINAAIFYPLKVLCYFLPIQTGFSLFLYAHVWFSFAGMHLLLREGFRLKTPGPMVGALVYGASGYMRGMWDTHNFLALPWIALGMLVLMRASDLRFSILLSALCWACLVLCGDVQAACGYLAVSACLVLAEWAKFPGNPHASFFRFPPFLALAGGVFAGTLLSAPQWMPTAYAAQASYRAGGMPWQDAMQCSFSPLRLLEMVVPYIFGTRDSFLTAPLTPEGVIPRHPWTSSFHIGRIALMCACMALMARKSAVRWPTGMALAGLVLAMGGFLPFSEQIYSLPILQSFRYPEKYLLWTLLGLSILSGTGATYFQETLQSPQAKRRWLYACGVLALLMAAGMACAAGLANEPLPTLSIHILGGAFTLAVLVALACIPANKIPLVLPVVLAGELFALQHFEKPVSSAVFATQPPVIVEQITGPGRFLADPAVVGVPMHPEPRPLRASEHRSRRHLSRLDFNAPRLWGLRTAGGFSPLESGAMRAARWVPLQKTGSGQLSVEDLVALCKHLGVEWLLTTSTRAEATEQSFQARRAAVFGPSGETVLLQLMSNPEAVIERPASERYPLDTVRLRPGKIRIDIPREMSSAGQNLQISETYNAGWRAADQWGNQLPVSEASGTMRVTLTDGVTQVRMQYSAPGWNAGLLAGGIGSVLLLWYFITVINPTGLKALLGSRATVIAMSILAATVAGCTARAHWSCTFDEGFHVTRGTTRLAKNDSRLCYFHPPLQNAICGYFGLLAHGDRMRFPQTPDWESADLFSYSVTLAAENRDVFPELVKASRWGTMMFFLLLTAVVTAWAFRLGGPLAAWLAGLGTALNPTLIAHGNLVTTDMGVLALGLCGSYLVARSVNLERSGVLWLASAVFGLAAVTKFTGLIWAGAYLLFCIPLCAFHFRSVRPLIQLAVVPLFILVAILAAYGPGLQEIRAPGIEPLDGLALPGGRYAEGLISQGRHAVEGHRGFFMGTRFTQGRSWYLPSASAMKTSLPWILISLAGGIALLRRWPTMRMLIPWIPAIVYIVMVALGSNIAIGVRHILPLLVLIIMVGATWCAGLANRKIRIVLSSGVLASTIATAVIAFPNYLSWFPAWTGGAREGYRLLADSNYDWGQDLQALEENWAALTELNRGRPPRLVYFGFLDPAYTYRLPVSQPSLLGFMDRTRRLREDRLKHDAWIASFLSPPEGITVFSLSAAMLEPFGIEMDKLRAAEEQLRIGHTLRVTGAPEQ